MQHVIFIIFIFAFGACVGSFLNVVVWRLPRGESIVSPPSHCPQCNTRLAWYDNIPVFGWLALGGKCRYCGKPISARYPIIEAITGGLFVLYYVAIFIYQEGPSQVHNPNATSAFREMTIQQDWPMYLLYLFLIGSLLATSLIDAEHFIVPIEIPWIVCGLGLLVHAFIDMPITPGSLNLDAPVAAMSAGATVGVLLSMLLLRLKIMPLSFAEGGPLMEIEKEALAREGGEAPPEFTRAQLRVEMGKEMLFLMPPLVLGGAWVLLCMRVDAIGHLWQSLVHRTWLSGLLGSLWGAMVGTFIIWFARIIFTIIFGREAMGLGDMHLMLGIGAVIGAAGAAVVFFLAPFVGLLFTIYKLLFRRGREVPFVPYLSLATGIVLLFYCRIIVYLTPPMTGFGYVLRRQLFGE